MIYMRERERGREREVQGACAKIYSLAKQKVVGSKVRVDLSNMVIGGLSLSIVYFLLIPLKVLF